MIQEQENPEPKKWYADAILIKLTVIAALIVALLIPSSWIQSMIDEREASEQAMRNDVSSKWSGNQLIQGPVLVLPYKKAGTQYIEYAYILPENLSIKANVKTELFHQGIIDATEYTSKIALNGNFTKPDLTKLGLDPSQILYEKARLIFSVSDLKGLKINPILHIQDQQYNPEPSYNNNTSFSKSLQITFTLAKDEGFTFSYDLDLKGTDQLHFLHIAKTTDVEVSSDWKSPLFSGRYLPDNRNNTATGFTAKWHMLAYNRPFPQQWLNDDTLLLSKKTNEEAIFGVKFSLPVDQYRKTMRTTRYSSLIILLTFVSLFLTEVIRKQKVHVFNYALIGAAMVVYYTLLLSFAEHLGYDIAYLIASVSTIILIAWFTSSLLGNKQVAFLFGIILSIFYGFIYVLIQLEELSLLIGSCALFVIIALLMYFSRKINWEKQ
jgi:inner membrane protein